MISTRKGSSWSPPIPVAHDCVPPIVEHLRLGRGCEGILDGTFDRHLQNNGNDCDDEIKNYRRNAARDLNGFYEWTAGDRGDDD
jgi:hypothetical protein